jgi:hypothetical protein
MKLFIVVVIIIIIIITVTAIIIVVVVVHDHSKLCEPGTPDGTSHAHLPSGSIQLSEVSVNSVLLRT